MVSLQLGPSLKGMYYSNIKENWFHEKTQKNCIMYVYKKKKNVGCFIFDICHNGKKLRYKILMVGAFCWSLVSSRQPDS